MTTEHDYEEEPKWYDYEEDMSHIDRDKELRRKHRRARRAAKADYDNHSERGRFWKRFLHRLYGMIRVSTNIWAGSVRRARNTRAYKTSVQQIIHEQIDAEKGIDE